MCWGIKCEHVWGERGLRPAAGETQAAPPQPRPYSPPIPQVAIWVLGEYGTLAAASPQSIMNKLVAVVTTTHKASEGVKAYVLVALSKLCAQVTLFQGCRDTLSGMPAPSPPPLSACPLSSPLLNSSPPQSGFPLTSSPLTSPSLPPVGLPPHLGGGGARGQQLHQPKCGAAAAVV